MSDPPNTPISTGTTSSAEITMNDNSLYVYDANVGEQFDEPNFLYKCDQISRNGLYPSIARIDAVSNIHVRFENDTINLVRLLGEALLVNTIMDRIDLLLDPYHFYTTGATSDTRSGTNAAVSTNKIYLPYAISVGR
jgi:hypothetical protein